MVALSSAVILPPTTSTLPLTEEPGSMRRLPLMMVRDPSTWPASRTEPR